MFTAHQRSATIALAGALASGDSGALSAKRPFGIGHLLQSTESSKMNLPFLPSLDLQKQQFPRQVVSGKGIDEVYDKNQNELIRLKDDNKQLCTENEQMKSLNEKLNDRCDFLQSIIDKEASANTFYYNYPPKPDETLKEAKAGN